MSAATVKQLIDQQVTAKTQPYSISNIEVGELLKSIVDLIGTGDASGVLTFQTTQIRLAYLTNDKARPFQIGGDLEDGNTYFINKAGTAWVFLGGSSSIKSEIISFSNSSTLNIQWDDIRRVKFGEAGKFLIEVLGDDGVYRQSNNVQISPNNITNTTVYTIDLGGTGQNGRLIIY